MIVMIQYAKHKKRIRSVIFSQKDQGPMLVMAFDLWFVCCAGKEVPVHVFRLHAHLQHSRQPAHPSENTPG